MSLVWRVLLGGRIYISMALAMQYLGMASLLRQAPAYSASAASEAKKEEKQ